MNMLEQLVERLNSLAARVAHLERLPVIPTVPLTDYSATSTITGWAAGYFSVVKYKKVGKTVYVYFYIDGTSNATSCSFSLPYSLRDVVNIDVPVRCFTTGLGYFWGMADLILSTSTVDLYPGPGGGAWANSNQRLVTGEFFYETE